MLTVLSANRRGVRRTRETVSSASFISNDIAGLINNAPEPRAFLVHSIYSGKSITGQGTCTGLLTETFVSSGCVSNISRKADAFSFLIAS